MELNGGKPADGLRRAAPPLTLTLKNHLSPAARERPNAVHHPSNTPETCIIVPPGTPIIMCEPAHTHKTELALNSRDQLGEDAP